MTKAALWLLDSTVENRSAEDLRCGYGAASVRARTPALGAASVQRRQDGGPGGRAKPRPFRPPLG